MGKARSRRFSIATKLSRPTVARFLGATLSVVLVAGLLQMLPTQVAAESELPARAQQQPGGDKASALVAAKLRGEPVEVTNLTTERGQVFANPDGTFTSKQYAQVQRVRQGDKWVGVDTSLVKASDGAIRPKAAAVDIAFSGGGAGPFAKITKDGHELSFALKGYTLAAPTVEGASATYPEVIPGVDLKLTARPEAFSELLVVKTPEAAKSPALNELKFTLTTAKLSVKVDAQGNLRAEDEQGASIFVAPTPLMWDSGVVGEQETATAQRGEATCPTPTPSATLSPSPSATPSPTPSKSATPSPSQSAPGGGGEDCTPVEEEPTPPRSEEEMKTVLNGSELVITPNQAMLDNPETVFPVYLDPTVGLDVDFFTEVDSGRPSSAFVGGQEGMPRSGTYNSGANTIRSYLRMDTREIKGKEIYWAHLKADLGYSWSGTSRDTSLQQTGWVDGNTTWSNQPSWDRWLGESGTAMGGNEQGSWDVSSTMRDASSGNWDLTSFVMYAHNEQDNVSWRKWAGIYIEVSYNGVPQVDLPSVEPGLNIDGNDDNDLGWTNTKTPTMKVWTWDEESKTDVVFELHEYRVGYIRQWQVDDVPAGSYAEFKIPDGVLDESKAYAVRMRSGDGRYWSEYSQWRYFKIDTSIPGTPHVSSSDYPNDGNWSGRTGEGSFLLKPATGSTDISAYKYKLDTDTDTKEVGATGDYTLKLTPEPGERVLQVWAKDRAGNLSKDPAVYRFNVGNAGMVSPRPGATVVERTKLEVEGNIAYTSVKFQYRRGPGGSVVDIPAANLIVPPAGAQATATTEEGVKIATPPGESLSASLDEDAAKGKRSTKTRLAMSDGQMSTAGGYVVWNAVETLGRVGGVAEVRAVLTKADNSNYETSWQKITVDPNGDGAASESAGPGSVNLLTGDYGVSVTDVDELGMSVNRSASSREPTDGLRPQGERLSANQQQVSTDLTGFESYHADSYRETNKGQGTSSDSLLIVPSDQSYASDGDTFVSVGGDASALRADMRQGRKYRVSGWIYAPGSTGLAPKHERGLKLVVGTNGPSGWQEVQSPRASYTDAWQELTVDVDIPANATGATIRLYNGFGNDNRQWVYWDRISVTELIAPFGPQWTGGPTDAAAGSDFSKLEFPEAHLAKVHTTQGGWLTFARSSTAFFPEPGAEDYQLAKIDDDTYQLREMSGETTEFKKDASGQFLVSTTWTPEEKSTTRYLYDSTDKRTLVRKVINPQEDGIGDCTTSTPARGCEVLEYVYADTTTATSTTWGDFKERVKAVKVWTWDPTANQESAVIVAAYRYDDQGRLREVSDPRLSPALPTTYDYDSAGRLVQAKAAGELPWYFDYGVAGKDQHPGRLLKVRRAALQAGTKDQLDGEIATKIVYDVPLTKGAGGPHDMDPTTIATWAQTDFPTDATAVFGPQDDPGTHTATGSAPGTGGYTYASIHYLNANTQEVNTATPGGAIDTNEYDRYGNVVRSLESTNRAIALGSLPDAQRWQAELGLAADSPERARQLSTYHYFENAGLDEKETVTPWQKMVLEEPIQNSLGMTVWPSGSTVVARGYTHRWFDEGKPDGAEYHLVTTEKTAAQLPGTFDGGMGETLAYPLGDVRVTKNGYNAEKGGTSGWKLKAPTAVTADVGGSTEETTYTAYDDRGRVTKAFDAGATGFDVRSSENIYYSAGVHPVDAACGNKPEWAGQLCVNKPSGNITGHDSARMPSQLPTKRVTKYSRYGDAAEMTETVGSTVRTTTTTRDALDRVTKAEITGGEGTAVPAVTTEYDPNSGRVLRTVSADGSAIIRTYDDLGRQRTYTDADGGQTTTVYDRFNRITSITDGSGSVSYGYDRAKEPRGMVTSLTDSVAGTFGASYGPDGQVVEQTYPGGMVRKDTLDASGQPNARTYSRASDGVVLYTETTVENARGKTISNSSSAGNSTYSYDRRGRLTTAVDDNGDTCAKRVYEFDRYTNRTKKTATNGLSGSACDSDATSTNHTFDSADRIQDTGFTYDKFGRITQTGAGTKNSYYTNDLVASQINAADNKRMNWTLDPALRFRSFNTETKTGETWNISSRKLTHYGDDSDEPRWLIADTTNNTMSRNISGVDGDLSATATLPGGSPTGADIRLQLTNLHGDVVMTIDTALTSPVVSHYDEYGNPADTVTATADARYGWLGGKQRSAETTDDTMLMGVRLYSPELGRFLQVDPMRGGNATAYDYCYADPINCTDLDGRWSIFSKSRNAIRKTAQKAKRVVTKAKGKSYRKQCSNVGCLTLQSTCSTTSVKGCSISWSARFHGDWSKAYAVDLHYSISVNGVPVVPLKSYGHFPYESGDYIFHGTWGAIPRNNAHARGYYRHKGRTYHLKRGDVVTIVVTGPAVWKGGSAGAFYGIGQWTI
ncbi:MAG: hypothetical protein HOQ05_07745 [Corynebacteriales bacterium]|nr:hypothetical protein [Mycobacteriales bacterium]